MGDAEAGVSFGIGGSIMGPEFGDSFADNHLKTINSISKPYFRDYKWRITPSVGISLYCAGVFIPDVETGLDEAKVSVKNRNADIKVRIGMEMYAIESEAEFRSRFLALLDTAVERIAQELCEGGDRY